VIAPCEARFGPGARGITAVEAGLALAAAQAFVGLSIRELAAQALRQLAQQHLMWPHPLLGQAGTHTGSGVRWRPTVRIRPQKNRVRRAAELARGTNLTPKYRRVIGLV
jgi:hypothetical protein